MRLLTGAFVKEMTAEVVNAKTIIHPFILQIGNVKTKYYAYKRDDQQRWIKCIREVIGYSNLEDFYEIEVRRNSGKL